MRYRKRLRRNSAKCRIKGDVCESEERGFAIKRVMVLSHLCMCRARGASEVDQTYD